MDSTEQRNPLRFRLNSLSVHGKRLCPLGGQSRPQMLQSGHTAVMREANTAQKAQNRRLAYRFFCSQPAMRATMPP